ncbi:MULTISPECIES: 1-acyl-sn-glycerol-3-phosphate acyltransferase [Pseudoalteromonas]|uniref:1-acyl-sn-glycerol-3-phosphate acyltransferase n=1 Tax=Pseudoalteromonas luteoviolacea (strain 2ta16) TaxID=1353533 RepID=V4HPK4_PSEL2|nr:1-acyl-sn-glycerol-3-phosphate acyltransferase [Pseudoalteromonas luteoviolacea]ESP91728.1 1-acyl-sn-glycerol-3-phosphate acyltransferase [Pseudoalteromonas luteoviolacea 2ta16]KZN40792.1 acyltransferase [Pseudoalteromonas luteoviolacea NCIMB 1944]MCG7546667.1 1-acyl-sn-glycerol-3-phosphate acyltransferase [Pseudoalteromonas sp. Of7M-16]
MDKYADIRPYNDDEVPAALDRLLADEQFLDVIAEHNLPKWIASFAAISRPLVKARLKSKWKTVNNVEAVQNEVAQYLSMLVERTTSKVTYSGLERLDKNAAYLFISNHRDIVLDPALVNWGLHQNNLPTVRIAIGDNLLQVPYITELMRLNKSFIVKRSAKAPKEMLKALSQLSGYIYDSLQEGNSIWIAQKEGRAKDGIDYTDPALLKMLQLQGRRLKEPFADYVRKLKVVPVSISYQYEPCALAKAKELYHKQQFGEYQKEEGEDIKSIIDGFSADKGNVHVAFGTPIEDDFETPEELAQIIDKQIIDNYYLHSTNYLAAGEQANSSSEETERFKQNIETLPNELKEFVLSMYAQPVKRKSSI